MYKLVSKPDKEIKKECRMESTEFLKFVNDLHIKD